jgi:hypothetical protein
MEKQLADERRASTELPPLIEFASPPLRLAN